MAKSQDASQPQYQIIKLKLILNEKCVILKVRGTRYISIHVLRVFFKERKDRPLRVLNPTV